jgi:CheY-like chemotaxis protein
VINILVGGLPRTLVASIEARIEGVAVHVVDTGAEALEWLAGRSCQLLVLDHSLAGLGAIDVVQALTEGSTSTVPVLYCLQRGAAMERERQRAERLGIRSFLTHPIDIELLADHIRRIAGPVGGNGNPSRNGGPAPADAAAPASGNGGGWQRLRGSAGGSTPWTRPRSRCSTERSATR